ncbi:phage tail length tape measure family protein [Sulfitobacter sp. G21635-S1]|uniref:phage tail length tape measure family protein n=1 Tax=Sulfitobacter sp. G21635-S1 TaxID=3014043 RepID=UPI0022AF3F10|nr:phage tail length tape measure family protein [Sulfitobacter sp. G21635-S1]MCZ4259014.1 phage tail length tape measure family protein [Sulfitobacter sp. G21635-S1]
MSGFKASLYIGGDASGAKKALGETASASAGARKAVDALEKSTSGLEQSTKGAGNANAAFSKQEKVVAQAVAQANTAIQQRIERLTGFGAATHSARESAAAFGGTIDQNRASFDSMRMSIDPVYRASRQYEAVTDETRRAVAAGAVTQAEANRVLALAEAQYLATGQSASMMARGTGVASGQLGNITAQFNDIGVMMAAGQNPIQLALQQGTQLNQVFATMGGGKAVLRSLASSALALVNPLSLATLGIIAGGAALIQWGSRALSAEEKTDDFGEAMKALAKETAEARNEVELFNRGLETTAQLIVSDEIAKKEAEIAALRNREKFGPRYLPGETDRQVAIIEEEIAALQEALAEREKAVAAEKRLAEVKETVNNRLQDFLSGVIQAAEKHVALQQSVDATVAGLEAEANIQSLIAQHGEDSRDVTAARVAEERRVYEATTLTADMSQIMKDEIMAAWDAANGVASVDMAGNIALATGEATRLSQQLAGALDLARRIAGYNGGVNNNGLDELDPRNPNNTRPGTWTGGYGTLALDDPRRNPKKRKGRSGGGGAAGKIKKQREAVADLIEGLEEEIDVLRETDPVQKEMLRHRETMAAATEAEREKIRELIAIRNQEKETIDAQKEAWESYRDIAYDTFEDLRRSGGDFGSVLDTLSGKIQDMAYEALLLGEGPLAQLFGTANGGGLIDVVLGAVFPNAKPAQALAEGGMIYGRGSGTSDNVPVWASSGEFMVNAVATAKNRALLEMINSGAEFPAFAKGGMIGGGTFSGGGNGSQIIIENHSGSPITQTRSDEVDGTGRRRTRFVLADAVGNALVQPGGGARRTLRNGFGVKKRGTLR